MLTTCQVYYAPHFIYIHTLDTHMYVKMKLRGVKHFAQNHTHGK